MYLWLPKGDGLALVEVSGVWYGAFGVIAASNDNALAIDEDYLDGIFTDSLEDGIVGDAYSETLLASGGVVSYFDWSVTGTLLRG